MWLRKAAVIPPLICVAFCAMCKTNCTGVCVRSNTRAVLSQLPGTACSHLHVIDCFNVGGSDVKSSVGNLLGRAT